MKLALLATLALAAFTAHAAETKPTAAPPKEVAGVKLARVCDACGVVGNKTTDSTVGTVGGAAVGGILGHQIERQLKKRKVYATSVTLKDGSTKKFDSENDPLWKAGTVVEVGADGKLKKR
jgi:outer membrane lipoprotein SlyB